MSATGAYNHNSAHTMLGLCVLLASLHEGLGRLTSRGRLGMPTHPRLISPMEALLTHPPCGVYCCGAPCLLALMIAVATVAADAEFSAIFRPSVLTVSYDFKPVGAQDA